MLADTPTVAHLSLVISQVTAPAFLLGAVAAFISLLIARMNRIIDRSQFLNDIPGDDPTRAELKSDLPRLHRRARLINRAILFATVAAIATALVVILAFVLAYREVRHEYGVALLFIIALGFFTAALVEFARECRIALHDFDHRR